jgi:hypothetical protein
MGRGKSITICSHEYNLVWVKKDLAPLTSLYIYTTTFSVQTPIYMTQLLLKTVARNMFTTWIVELYCVNQAHNSPSTTSSRTTWPSCVFDLLQYNLSHEQVLYATVLGKSCVDGDIRFKCAIHTKQMNIKLFQLYKNYLNCIKCRNTFNVPPFNTSWAGCSKAGWHNTGLTWNSKHTFQQLVYMNLKIFFSEVFSESSEV